MAITISGRLVDDAGNGINGAAVSVIPVGSGTPDATDTTAAHPTNAEAGWFEFTTLDGTKTYKTQVSYQGRTREFYGLSAVQFDRVTIGASQVVLSNDGKITLSGSTTGSLLSMTNADAAALGVQITALHNSASPSINDAVFRIVAQGKDSAGNTTAYGSVSVFIGDPADGSEDSYWLFQSMKGAVSTNVAVLSPLGTQLLATDTYVGVTGSTNPVLYVNGSVASQATGLSVTGRAAAGGVDIAAISSATNENLRIDAKGSGTITLGTGSTGNIVLGRLATTALGVTVSGGALTVSGGTGLVLSNGIDAIPGGTADVVKLGAVDLSAGNATLAIGTETAVTAAAAGASDAYLNVKINGTTYKLLLHT